MGLFNAMLRRLGLKKKKKIIPNSDESEYYVDEQGYDNYPQYVNDELNISENEQGYNNGAMCKYDYYPKFVNDEFSENEQGYNNGAMCQYDNYPQSVNDELSENEQGYNNGAMCKYDNYPESINDELSEIEQVYNNGAMCKYDNYPQSVNDELSEIEQVYNNGAMCKYEYYPESINDELSEIEQGYNNGAMCKYNNYTQSINDELSEDIYPYYEHIVYNQDKISTINNNNNVKEAYSQTKIINQMEISYHTISLPIKKKKYTIKLIKNTVIENKVTDMPTKEIEVSNEDKVCDLSYTYCGIEPEHDISLADLRNKYLVSKTRLNLSPIFVKDVNK